MVRSRSLVTFQWPQKLNIDKRIDKILNRLLTTGYDSDTNDFQITNIYIDDFYL